MASIEVYGIGNTFFSVKLTGLQSGAIAYTRRCEWFASTTSGILLGYSDITPEDGRDGEGGYYTFEDLPSNTEYTITCNVYRTDTNALIATLPKAGDPSVKVTTISSGGGSGGTSDVWTPRYETLGVISGETSKRVNLGIMEACGYAVEFKTSGIATFYTSNTSGDGDPRGYLVGTSREFDAENGEPPEYLNPKFDDDSAGYPEFEISYNVTAGILYYIWVRDVNGDLSFTTYLHITPPQSDEPDEPDEPPSESWSWSDKAKNAFENNGKTTDVTYTEWNNFVKFVEAKTNVDLSSAEIDPSDKTIYASKFNAVRRAIGGKNTFQNGTNSIKDHYNGTGSWDMSKGDIIKGQYFIDLAKYANDIS